MSENQLRNYSKPRRLGDKFLGNLFDGTPVLVQEKVDGSQISFGVRDGKLFMKSRTRMLDVENNTTGLFARGIKAVKAVQHLLEEGYTYRGEYLNSEKHNVIRYGRIPTNHIILFDVDRGEQKYFNQIGIERIAKELGFEAVPMLAMWSAQPTHWMCEDTLKTRSVLSGSEPVLIEGFVMKNYNQSDGHSDKVLMGKYVNDEFMENSARKGRTRKTPNVLANSIAEDYITEARYRKAIQHLREDGVELSNSMRDMPLLIKEVSTDLYEECYEEIKDRLLTAYTEASVKVLPYVPFEETVSKLLKTDWKTISSLVIKGLKDFYLKYINETTIT